MTIENFAKQGMYASFKYKSVTIMVFSRRTRIIYQEGKDKCGEQHWWSCAKWSHNLVSGWPMDSNENSTEPKITSIYCTLCLEKVATWDLPVGVFHLWRKNMRDTFIYDSPFPLGDFSNSYAYAHIKPLPPPPSVRHNIMRIQNLRTRVQLREKKKNNTPSDIFSPDTEDSLHKSKGDRPLRL